MFFKKKQKKFQIQTMTTMSRNSIMFSCQLLSLKMH